MFRQYRLYTLAAVMVAMMLMTMATGCGEKQNITGPQITAQLSDTTTTGIEKPGAEMSSTQGQRDWWHSLGQNGRNSAIVNRAMTYYGRSGYPNCKAWVQQVVSEASQTVVWVPKTLPGENGWYFDYSPYMVGMSGGIYGVHPGSIIQMRWRTRSGYTPHTMIVHSVGSGGFWVIEANWIPGTVGMRWITYSDFLAGAIIYSTYTVTG